MSLGQKLCRDAAVALDATHLLEAERSRQVLVLMRKLKKHRKQLESMRIKAKGVSLLPRTLMVKRPKSTNFASYARDAEKFQNIVRFTPSEFCDLVEDVRELMLEARDSDSKYSLEENATWQSRAGKFSVEERLFMFLVWVNEYPKFRSQARQIADGRRLLSDSSRLLLAEARVGGHLKIAETCHLRTHGPFFMRFFA